MRWLPQTSNKARSTSPTIFRRTTSNAPIYWNPEKALREALTRVTWVFRCVDAIATNQAKLPLVLRSGDSVTGPEILDHPLLSIYNSRANIGEDSFVFRHRLSAQLLLSSKGAFIEVHRNNAGEPYALGLLDPMRVFPVPDEKKHVAQYTLKNADGGETPLKPENVIWMRKPHPFDAYGALTPLEAAGLAIETDWLAKLYNRNFLLNDGRPGGLIILKGEASEEDKEELRARYRGNLNTAGRIGVITAEQGADWVDTAVSPRDSQYDVMRKLSKEEILGAFGVDETVLGDTSGRTFDNAEQARLVFWQETMPGHLQLIARPLDVLDADPQVYTAFDTSVVDVLQRAEARRREFLLREWMEGAISQDEYRLATGRKKLQEGGNRLYVPTNRGAVGTTDGPLLSEGELNPTQDVGRGGNAVPNDTTSGVQGGRPEGSQDSEPRQVNPIDAATRSVVLVPATNEGFTWNYFNTGADSMPITWSKSNGHNASNVKISDTEERSAVQQLLKFKEEQSVAYERWELIVERALQRFFERQQRVVTEKVKGAKMRRQYEAAQRWVKKNPGVEPPDSVKFKIDPEQIYDEKVWDDQINQDVDPILVGVMEEFGTDVSSDFDPRSPESQKYRDRQITRLKKINDTTKERIANVLAAAVALNYSLDEIEEDLNPIFDDAIDNRAKRIATTEVVAAAGAAIKLAAKKGQTKTWVTMGDDRVRDTHQEVEGETRGIDEPFSIGGGMQFPGDPKGPGEETVGCRCTLLISGEAAA